MANKITVVWVPGAWHSPTAFEGPASHLKHESAFVHLPSVGASPGLKNWDEDVAAIQAAIKTATGKGNDVVLVCHSYGGIPTSQSVVGFAKHENPSKPGVLGIVYLTAFALPQGVCLIDAVGGDFPPWFAINEEEQTATVKTPYEVFYGDCSDDVWKPVAASLKPHSIGTMRTPLSTSAHLSLPTAYIVCTQDGAIPAAGQEGMAAFLKEKGDLRLVEKLEASHSPFLSLPEETASAVDKAVKAFA